MENPQAQPIQASQPQVSSDAPKEEPQDLTAGPGAVADNGEAPKPLLEGMTEEDYVEILNPLSVDFAGIFGTTKPVRAPIKISGNPQAPGVTESEQDVKQNYGLDLRNPLHQGKASIQNKIVIKSGKTIRLLGNEAQVVVRQLVREIMQREGKKLLLADPFAQRQVEERVVLRTGRMSEFMGEAQSRSEQLRNVIEEKNEQTDFPDAIADESADRPEEPVAEQSGTGNSSNTAKAQPA